MFLVNSRTKLSIADTHDLQPLNPEPQLAKVKITLTLPRLA